MGYGDLLKAAFSRGGVPAFETTFAQVVGQRFAIAFPYGRTGLIALLRALDLHDADILCPAYTCVVVPNAIVTSGNRPVFLDSGTDANADLARVSRNLTGGPAALIATSIFGHPVDLDALDELRARHPDLPVIQDCAHSFLCSWRGRPVHREGKAAFFGLNISKTVTSIFGGMVTTDDEGLANRIIDERERMLRPAVASKSLMRFAYGLAAVTAFRPAIFTITNRMRSLGLLDRFTRYYDESVIDMPADHLDRLTDFEARVGTLATPRLQANIEARRRYDSFYRQELADHPSLGWIPREEGTSVSHSAARVARRDAVRLAAAARGVELGEVIEYSVPDMAAYRPYLRAGQSFPVARQLAASTINLPTATLFDPRMAAKVVAVMREVLRDEPAAGALGVG
jgi:dTDP-4-amino-4,6-dideoxygalactose transaminase